MNIHNLPYIHYFVRSKDGQLISPFEYVSDVGGSFYIPLYGDNLAPGYKFHYTIYLGNGEFYKNPDETNMIFIGLAIPIRTKNALQFLMEFNAFPPIPNCTSKSLRHFPGAVNIDGDLVLPMFKRINKKTIAYGGKCQHPDLKHTFIEIGPSDNKVFDELLESYGISIIGCDPHITYEKPIMV